ncbi:MAG: SDR family NAD(P)-dependent oxidoreductase [Treponema sp.]|jgi:sorbitol-6-phosphate 2-dehydrogenase|nr:SDR family NAD(P)-dependent oxidoreductase [Treponema sp.]
MKTEALFAPLVRGAVIEKTGRPWIVCYDGAAAAEGLRIVLGEKDRDRAGAIIGEALAGEREIPRRIRIICGGAEYSYLAAPDCAGIEALRRGKDRDGAGSTEEAPPDAGPWTAARRAGVVRNRVALVTGGAQGFGAEIVRGLAAAGAIVYIADLNAAGARELAEKLNGEYGRPVAFPVEVDVADEESVRRMAGIIALGAGGLDLCVSNAGVLRAAGILEQDMASFEFVTGINYTAFAMVTKHCGLLMKAQNEAAPSWMTDIIQINSKSGLEGSGKNGSYAGSKFGGIGLVQSFAKELVEYRIKVNAVCPGNFYEGPLWSDPVKGLFVQYLNTGKVPGAKTVEDVRAYYEAKVPMGRGCSGPDVMRAVFYLVEQEYETGQALPVTGGQVMMH